MLAPNKDLATLARLSPKLNDYTDKLDRKLNSVQWSLRRSNVRLEVWLCEPLLLAAPEEWTYQVGWAKGPKRWALCVRRTAPTSYNQPQYLMDSSLDVRIAALDRMGELVKQLSRETTEGLDMLEGVDLRESSIQPTITTSAYREWLLSQGKRVL